MSKHYLLVGANSGIGLAAARALSEAGHGLSAAARNAAPLAVLESLSSLRIIG